jgi:hypothetical protein
VGKVAKQQTTGPLQLPLNNCGVMALDYNGKKVATSMGHSPVAALLILLQEVERHWRGFIEYVWAYQRCLNGTLS